MLTNAIIIPAYNEANTISDVVGAVRYMGTVIVVDDGSSDSTGSVASKAGAEVVRHSINMGYDKAIQSGFEKALQLNIDTVITFDADGQHDPTVLKDVLWCLQQAGSDLVICTRPRGARFAEKLFNSYVRYRYGVPDILCGLKGYRIQLYRNLGCFMTYKSVGTELALFGLRTQCSVTTLPIVVTERADKPRFASMFIANMKIMYSLWRAVIKDYSIPNKKQTSDLG